MAAVEVSQNLEYMGGHPFIPMTVGQRKPKGQWTADERKDSNLDQRLKSLIMSVLPDDQMNFVINCLTAKSTRDDLILYHEGPSDVKESWVMYLKLNDGINLSKLEINTGFINALPKKWLSFCQSLRNTNHVKDSEFASLFGKLKYEENLINNSYENEKNKSLISATPLSTAFISTSIVKDFSDSPDDEEDTGSSHEYLNDLKEEYQARALLTKSKRFFKKGTQRFSSAKATDQTECHKYGKKEEVSSHDNEMVEVKVLMVLAERMMLSVKKALEMVNGEQIPSQKKIILVADQLTKDPSSSGQNDLVFVKSLADDTKVSIPGIARPWLSEAEGSILPNHDTGRILPVESQRNTIDPSVAVTDFLTTDYDSVDESSIYSTPLPSLKKLDDAEPISGPKTIKSILKSKSTFKAETLKCVIINESSSAPAKDNKSASASKVNPTPASRLKSVKTKDDPPLAIIMKELNNLKL
ncbi:hypothetical protein Tco_0110451 [Tanacetum coccineum]